MLLSYLKYNNIYNKMSSPLRQSNNVSMNNSLNTTSHNAERISAIGEKLSQLQMNLQNDKLSKLEKIDEALKDTEIS